MLKHLDTVGDSSHKSYGRSGRGPAPACQPLTVSQSLTLCQHAHRGHALERTENDLYYKTLWIYTCALEDLFEDSEREKESGEV